MDRRAFVRGMAALQLASLASGASLTAGAAFAPKGAKASALTCSDTAFNVYLHGLFCINFNSSEKQIEAHIPLVNLSQDPTHPCQPDDHCHVYQAGSPADSRCSNFSKIDLKYKETYTLKSDNYSSTKFPAPPKDGVWIDPQDTTVKLDDKYRHCYLDLPLTDIPVLSHHRVTRQDGLPFFSGQVTRAKHFKMPDAVGRTYVIQYKGTQPLNPRLVDSSGTPVWKYSNSCLHIFSQPDHPVSNPNSVLAAFDQLRYMMGNLELFATPFDSTTFTPADLDDPCDLGLGEQLQHQHHWCPFKKSQIGGGETANCVGLFVGP